MQAPRPRPGGGGPSAADGRRRWLIPAIVALAGAAVVALLLGMFAFGGGESGTERLAAADCAVEKKKAQSRAHVNEAPADFDYNTDPPTSGPHSGIPAPYDAYDQPVEQFRLIHNLEHGAVVIQYGPEVPQGDINELLEWYREEPNGLIVAPYPPLGNQIALAAWWTASKQDDEGQGVLAKCARFDEGAFDAFIDEYGFQGPESDRGDGQGFRREDLQPGST